MAKKTKIGAMTVRVSKLPPLADYLNEQLVICRSDKRANIDHLGHLLHALYGDRDGAALKAVKKEQKIKGEEFEIFLLDCLRFYVPLLERASEQMEEGEFARRWSWFLHGCKLAEADPEETASVALFARASRLPAPQKEEKPPLKPRRR